MKANRTTKHNRNLLVLGRARKGWKPKSTASLRKLEADTNSGDRWDHTSDKQLEWDTLQSHLLHSGSGGYVVVTTRMSFSLICPPSIAFWNAVLLISFIVFNGPFGNQLSPNVLDRSSPNVPTRCSFSHNRKSAMLIPWKYPQNKWAAEKGTFLLFRLIIFARWRL